MEVFNLSHQIIVFEQLVLFIGLRQLLLRNSSRVVRGELIVERLLFNGFNLQEFLVFKWRYTIPQR